MQSLFVTFVRISLLRAGPQALPASSLLLGLALVAHWTVGTAIAGFGLSLPHAAVVASIGTLLVLTLVHGALVMRGRMQRFVQTATAMAGCEVVIGLVMVPVVALYMSGGELAAAWLSILLLAWNTVVAMHVFRHALDLTVPRAFAAAFGYILISTFVSGLVTPAG